MADLIYNFVYLALSALFIGGVWWGTLRLMDHAAGMNFRREVEALTNDPIAAAIYFGLRLIALALLFSPLLRVVLI